ncbi:hypothetical protein [Rheinheimera fenheensis]|uniref:hypothetical protein n=1 Tax=Rheinheimera fenheensis TaxID=3152295 RepID=UPI00325E38DF
MRWKLGLLSCFMPVLFGCSGGNSSDDELALQLTNPVITVNGDMLVRQNVKLLIGTTNYKYNSLNHASFDLQVQHPVITGTDISVEDGKVYALLFVHWGYPSVDRNAPTRLALPATLHACSEDCTKAFKGAPAQLTINLNFNPADVDDVPEQLTFSSAEAGDAAWLESTTEFKINNTSTEPLHSELTGFDEALIYEASLRLKEGSADTYQLNLRFANQAYLTNELHSGHVSMRFCYDRFCDFPVKDGEKQIAVAYNQLGEPFKSYPELNVVEQVLPSNFNIRLENHLFASNDIFIGYRTENGENTLVSFELDTKTVTEQTIEGDLYNAKSGAGYLVVTDSDGMQYQHNIYKWAGNEVGLTDSFTSDFTITAMSFYNDAVYFQSNDSISPYRYVINSAAVPENGRLHVDQTTVVNENSGDLYSFYNADEILVSRWSVAGSEPTEIYTSKPIDSAAPCNMISKLLGNHLLTSCGEVFTLSDVPSNEFNTKTLLPLPDTHTINSVAYNKVLQNFVLVLHPKDNDHCNPIKQYCSLIIQRYDARTLALIDEFGWSEQKHSMLQRVLYPSVRTFFNSAGDSLYIYENSSAPEENDKLYRIELPAY